MNETVSIKRSITIGDVKGLVENARYIEGELKKTIDVSITELIKPRSKKKTALVLKSAYTELQRKYDELLSRADELSKQQNKSQQTITNLQSSTESAIQTSDADRKRREQLELDVINNNNNRVDSINELNELKEQLLQSKLDTVSAKIDRVSKRDEVIPNDKDKSSDTIITQKKSIVPDIVKWPVRGSLK